ncbi:VanW family protein [Gilliamella mensalis]|uniref:VanW family protein n=1 Tax=Gilliamella mensalis TaxID=1908520 RepID=UPI001ABFBB14|nr:VanW family protein [Gilliamella mensalis]
MYLQYNKITNLRLAIEKLNGSIIKPNQHFSIWQKVGRPSKKRGFLEGLSLHNGADRQRHWRRIMPIR